MGLKLNLIETSVDAANNTSKVRADLYYYGNGSSWNYMSPSGYIILNGSRKNFNHNFYKSKGAQFLASYEIVVAHDSNGKKTVSASASFTTDTSLGVITDSATKKLTDIARAMPVEERTSYTDLPSSITTYWKTNQGISQANHTQVGKVSLLGTYAAPENYGSGDNWHGPTLSRIAESLSSFQIQWSQLMAAKSVEEIGELSLLATNGNNIVAGVRITKSAPGTLGRLKLIANNETVEEMDISISENNEYFGAAQGSVKSCSISKSGDTIIFDIAGIKKTFSIPEIANSSITKVVIGFYAYGSSAKLSYAGVYNCKLVKIGSEFIDMPNTFVAGDKLTIDVGQARVMLNGLDRPDLGQLGNDWEKIELTKGVNQIGVAHSTFSEPSVRMKYREVFI